jgi:hypothetical protein
VTSPGTVLDRSKLSKFPDADGCMITAPKLFQYFSINLSREKASGREIFSSFVRKYRKAKLPEWRNI